MHKSPYSDSTIAGVYKRVAAPLQFAAPGRDLVEIVGVRPGNIVLDVGTGTAVVAGAARMAAGPSALIVGVDASMEMVRLAPKEAASFVLAQVPDLPFSDASFDSVIAGFVV